MWSKWSPIVVCVQRFAKKQPSEPLKPTVPPSLPWQKIGTDLFEFQGGHYLLSVCYRSKFPEVTKMKSLRSSVVVEELKTQFGAHGIPAEVVSDNGPQFSSSEFQEFAKEYGFKHVTSSPHYPKANGEAERAVQTLKNLWPKSSDKYRALLDYRTTPIPGIELSPAQLLMGRCLRNRLPMMDSLLQPASVNQNDVSKYLKKIKDDQKKHHDRHASSKLKELQPAMKVRMQPWTDSREWKPATVVRHHHAPRSYVFQADNGRNYHRNRQHLRVCPAPGPRSLNAERSLDGSAHHNLPKDQTEQPAPPVSPVIPPPWQHHNPEPPEGDSSEAYVTRSGRQVLNPKRLDL